MYSLFHGISFAFYDIMIVKDFALFYVEKIIPVIDHFWIEYCIKSIFAKRK